MVLLYVSASLTWVLKMNVLLVGAKSIAVVGDDDGVQDGVVDYEYDAFAAWYVVVQL